MERSSSGGETSVQCVFTWINRVVVVQGQRSPTRVWYHLIIIRNCDAQLTWKVLNWFWLKKIHLHLQHYRPYHSNNWTHLHLFATDHRRKCFDYRLMCATVEALSENVLGRCYPYFLPKLCSPLVKCYCLVNKRCRHLHVNIDPRRVPLSPELHEWHSVGYLPRNHGFT